jgi:hypothetical protein
MNGYVELKVPDKLAARGYKKAVDKKWVNMFRVFGRSETGGFYDTPFGSTTYNAYWTVLGHDIAKPIYECGSNHKVGDGYVPEDEDPQGVYTHHSIWFRGKPPTPEEVQARLVAVK